MRRLAALLGLCFLAGCQPEPPPSIYHKTGSTYAERSLAYDECTFEAVQAVPRALATEVRGGYYNPGTVQCSSSGFSTTCNRIGAVNIPASSSTYDANSEIRARYMDRCMEKHGYSLLTRPKCKTKAEIAQAVANGQLQPPPEQITCVMGQR